MTGGPALPVADEGSTAEERGAFPASQDVVSHPIPSIVRQDGNQGPTEQISPTSAAQATPLSTQEAPASVPVSTDRASSTKQSITKKGRRGLGLEVFLRFQDVTPNKSGKKGTVKFLCCPAETWRAYNPTRVYQHLRECPRFFRMDAAGLERIVRLKEGDEAADEIRRRRDGSLAGQGRNVGARGKKPVQLSQGIDNYFSVVNSEKKAKLDAAWASVIIRGGHAFSLGTDEHWRAFFSEAFGDSWKPPSRHTITEHYLSKLYRESRESVLHVLSSTDRGLCMGVDGFSDANSRSLFNVNVGGPLPFVFSTFRLDGELESAANLASILSTQAKEVSGLTSPDKPEGSPDIFGFVSDSPNVMTKTRRLLVGEEIGSGPMAFAYGCVCHALSNSVKDLCKNLFVKTTLSRCVKVVRFFKNTHVASALLLQERTAMSPSKRTRTLKGFSSTRWNGAAECIDSCVENQSLIVGIFTRQKMLPEKDRKMDFVSNTSLAKDIVSFILDGEFWESLRSLLPIFRIYNRIVTELESDTVPISSVLLAFTLLFELAPILSPSPDAHRVCLSMQSSLLHRYRTIYSPVHVLSCILDPAIPHCRLAALENFHIRALTNPQQPQSPPSFHEACLVALRTTGKFLSVSEDCMCEAEGQLSLLLTNFGQKWRRADELSLRNHPILYWMIEGKYFANYLPPFSKLVFSLYPSSAGLERSFKVNSRVLTKTRNRLSDENADKQASIIYNTNQLRRINTHLQNNRKSTLQYVLNRGHSGPHSDLLLQQLRVETRQERLRLMRVNLGHDPSRMPTLDQDAHECTAQCAVNGNAAENHDCPALVPATEFEALVEEDDSDGEEDGALDAFVTACDESGGASLV